MKSDDGKSNRQSVCDGFAGRFSGVPRVYRAPARVNIIGEHTDYNEGFVLPTTTALHTWVAATAREDRIIRVYSEHAETYGAFSLDGITKGATLEWLDYIKGVALVLQSEGVSLGGADLYVAGDIPVGGGLSSSASLELSSGLAMLGCGGQTIPGAELARICQRAESEFVGLACGIMDQLAVACCERQRAMLLDCRNGDTESVVMPDAMRLLIVDSGVKHQLPDGGYNDRTAECAAAIEILRRDRPELTSLRDLALSELVARRVSLGDTLFRRCRHVVTEISRTVEASRALAAGDLVSLGRLVRESHASLRDDYEVSCNDVDRLVDIANNCEAVHGARMVGAGFGGCVVAVVNADAAEDCRSAITEAYALLLGRRPWSHVVCAANPAQSVPDGPKGC